MAVIGIGVDVADVERFAAAVRRTPSLLTRVLTEAERSAGRPERLAARFAAKEALAKALGAPGGLDWQDAEVVIEPSGAPSLRVRGTIAAVADRLGVRNLHLSLSHDGGLAIAFVIAES